MTANDEEFDISGDWLSEQFTIHETINSDYKENLINNEIVIGEMFQTNPNQDISIDFPNELPAYDLTINRLDPFQSDFKQNLTPVEDYNIKCEILDLNGRVDSTCFAVEEVGNINPMDLTTEALDLTTSVQLVQMPVEGGVKKSTYQNFIIPFNPVEEEMKLLKFLEEKPINTTMDPSSYIPIQIPPITSFGIFKCVKCNYLFDTITFQSHVCFYNEAQKIAQQPLPSQALSTQPLQLSSPISCKPVIPLTSSPSSPSPKPVKESNRMLLTHPACIRLLNENQIRIRRFLKDELKYDVYAAGSGLLHTRNSNSITDTSISSNETSSTEMLNVSSTSSKYNYANPKKQEGPHECTLCERKFVHASGLLRHMEKHAMDLIPTSNTTTFGKSSASNGNSATQNVNGLKVVIKCTLCGRIFFDQSSAFLHLCSHFPSSWMDEKETDNCADIPYESYMDDAIYLLRQEAYKGPTSINNSIANYQEQKTPMYLKMIILTCILQCEFCDFVFSDVSYLFVHSACHIPERRFECFSCEIHVRTCKEICHHWQAECVFMRENTKLNQAITQRYFVCNVCENKFPSLELLHEHRYTSYHFFPRLNVRLGILQLPCEFCDQVFKNAQECVTHFEDKHYRKNRRGDKDGSVNSSKTRQYLCDICGKSYTQSSHLWQHLRFHQGVKPFACKEPGCTRKFTIRPDLNDHVRKCHTGERPYHCLVCGKRFLTGSVFYQHRLIHRGERRYECDECGKRFYRADALKNHQRIHTGEKPFGCLFCTKNFRQRGDRDKHMRARHSHLDANARLMMQMQKLQLEAAAAAAHGTPQSQNKLLVTTIPTNTPTVSCSLLPSIPINNENMPTCSTIACEGAGEDGTVSDNDVVMIGNVAFPKTMIESLMMDMDEESFQTAMQQNPINYS